MTKPTDNPDWATDANYAADGDSWSSTATKVDPGAARRAEGAEPDTFAAQWFNFILNAHGNILSWLLDSFTSDDEHQYPDGAKTRYTNIPLMSGFDATAQDANEKGWNGTVYSTGGARTHYLTSQDDYALVAYSLSRFLPHGAQIAKIEALVQPGAGSRGSGNEMEIRLMRSTIDWNTPSISGTVIASNTAADTVGVKKVALTSLSETIDNEIGSDTGTSYEVILVIVAGNDGGAHNDDGLYGIKVEWTDPGLTNR